MLTYMATVKWDIKDIMSQHSQYVDSLLKVSLVVRCTFTSYLLYVHLFNFVFTLCLLQEFAEFGDKISRLERYVLFYSECSLYTE